MKKLIALHFILFAWVASLNAQYDVSVKYKIDYLVKTVFLGSPDIQVSNITFNGATHAMGYFSYPNGKLGMTDGILLTTGSIYGSKGPNNNPVMGSDNNRPGDTQLSKMAGKTTFDAVSVEFDFYPVSDRIEFRYVFASEEFLEYVNRGFNDVFGFFLSGPGIYGTVNLAKLPDSDEIISVNSINDRVNSQFYIDNGSTLDPRDKNAQFKSRVYDNHLQWDGFTTVLVASHKVTPYSKYRIKIAIADAGDGVVDSGVYLKAKSFKSTGTPVPPPPGWKNDAGSSSQKPRKPLPRDILIEYDFDSHIIPDTSKSKLYFMYKDIKDFKEAKIEIRGHTDYKGSDQFNQQLSNRRVAAVVSYLIHLGYPRGNIVVRQGYGEKVPKASNETDQGRQRNRRVEVKILWNYYQPKK